MALSRKPSHAKGQRTEKQAEMQDTMPTGPGGLEKRWEVTGRRSRCFPLPDLTPGWPPASRTPRHPPTDAWLGQWTHPAGSDCSNPHKGPEHGKGKQ